MSRLNIKKIAALATAAAVAAQFTACGENTTWGAEANGERIPAGVFIYYLESAYYDARSKITEENPDLTASGADFNIFDYTVEGSSASSWIVNEATRAMKEYAAVEAKFNEYSLTLSSDTVDAVKLYCDQLWDYGGEYYTEMGISQKSYQQIFLNGEKRDMLFETLYFEGGDYGVSDDEAKSYLDENYVMINYIEMELKDGEGNLLKSDGKAERRAMAEDYIERYKNGEDFDTLNAEYVTYYRQLQDEAAAKAAEAAAEEDESDKLSEEGGLITAEVDGSEANASGVSDEDESDETDEDEESEEAEEENGEEDEQDESEEDEEPAEDAEAEVSDEDEDVSAEESGTDEEEDSEADEDEASDETDSEEESDSEESGSEEDHEENTEDETAENNETDENTVTYDEALLSSVPSNKKVVDKDTVSPAAEVTEAAFDMAKGDIQIVESADGEHYYVVLKMDILETDEYFDTVKGSLLYEMRSDDYAALITQWTESQSFRMNSEAYERYSPEKIFA